MANEKPQNFQNHVRLVPLFHMFVLPVLLINLVGSIIDLVRTGISFGSVMDVLVAFALFVLAVLRARVRADCAGSRHSPRNAAAPGRNPAGGFAAAHSGIHVLGNWFPCALRATRSLPALARKVLDEKLNNRKTIKQLIKDWQADCLRA